MDVPSDPAVVAGQPALASAELAPFGRRAAAFVLDWMLCILVGTLFGDPRRGSWAPVAVLVVAHTFFVGLFGQTPGMAVTGLRCVSFTDGGAIGLPRALLRSLLLILLVPALLLDGMRRGLHDKAGGSIVVRPARPA